jgi:hypothetical protein
LTQKETSTNKLTVSNDHGTGIQPMEKIVARGSPLVRKTPIVADCDQAGSPPDVREVSSTQTSMLNSAGPRMEASDEAQLGQILAQCYRLARERARKVRAAVTNPNSSNPH